MFTTKFIQIQILSQATQRQKMNSSSESESDYENDGFDSGDLEIKKITPFAFQPTHTEEEIEEKLRMLVSNNKNTDCETEENENDDTDTCLCQHCIDMGVENIKLCCRREIENPSVQLNGEECVTATDAFLVVCTNKDVLGTALGAWHHMNGKNLEICNKSYRFIAYRQYIWWQYGKLGKGVRRRIPTCVLSKIRQTFPAADGVYVPFSYGEEE